MLVEEMVSGPDLGAGFLYQLTRRREPPMSTFTFHAQDGGADANGPPIGNPEPFGWSRPGAMCPFGGRVCWHRSFRLDDREVAGVRASYNRTRFVMEAQLAQAYRARPVPWESALDEWCRRVAPALDALPARWSVEGDVARALAHPKTDVRTISIRTTEAGVATAASVLPEFLIEPAAWTEWGGRPCHAARAFVGTLQQGARVEWMAVPSNARVSTVTWSGHAVPVSER